MNFKTIMFYTDTIAALVEAATPIQEALQDAEEREDEAVVAFLSPILKSLKKKLLDVMAEGQREEEWTPRELGEVNAARLFKLTAPKV